MPTPPRATHWSPARRGDIFGHTHPKTLPQRYRCAVARADPGSPCRMTKMVEVVSKALPFFGKRCCFASDQGRE